MKSSDRFIVSVAAIVLVSASAWAAPAPKDKDKDKDKPKDPTEQTVDSGSFGIFMAGRRVGTETFTVTEDRNGSTTKSEFATVNAPSGSESQQSSVLQLAPNGEIRRYDWKELSPGRAVSVVQPNDQFLNQKWSSGPQDKPHEQPYLLPPSTFILDDYFFIHREILVWRFLGEICKQENGKTVCPQKQRTQFGTMIPRQHTSAPLSASFLGREKMNYKGAEHEFNKVELKNDSGTWELWLDDQLKLIRVWIEDDRTEVIRD